MGWFCDEGADDNAEGVGDPVGGGCASRDEGLGDFVEGGEDDQGDGGEGSGGQWPCEGVLEEDRGDQISEGVDGFVAAWDFGEVRGLRPVRQSGPCDQVEREEYA